MIANMAPWMSWFFNIIILLEIAIMILLFYKNDYIGNGECFVSVINQIPEFSTLFSITHHFKRLTIMAKLMSVNLGRDFAVY